MAKRSPLGKGLGSMFSVSENQYQAIDQGAVNELRIAEIEPDPLQPRKDFDPEKLEALAASIREHGIIQPLVVSKQDNGFYRIIAGERRWRAAKLAGLQTVPVVLRDYSVHQAAEVALVENLQRTDLNAMEEAGGYQRLMQEFGLTQQQVAERVGKSRPAVANSLRLLQLPESVQDMVVYGELSGGHARAIAALNDAELQKDVAQQVIAQELNVRQTERLIADLGKKSKKKEKPVTDPNLQSQLKTVEQALQSSLGTKVRLTAGKKKGKIEIEFCGLEELNRLWEKLK